MRFVALIAILAMTGFPDSQGHHRGIGHVHPHRRVAPIVPSSAPPYDAVYGIATHNSYWIDRDPFGERAASGTQERILDQLLHEQVRALELDVHFDERRPGIWSVYHTDKLQNSFCATLGECLNQLRLFHYLVPQHDVVNVVIELKELWGHVFNATHTIEQFDAVLRGALGSALYTPRDFAARCPARSTLRACAATAGWPSIDALRGKFIVNVLGNFNRNANDWVEYATAGRGVLDRAAFPMRTILDDNGGGCTGLVDEGVHDPIDPRAQARARDASIFWQVEELDYAGVDRFVDEHGIIRGRGSDTYAEQMDRLRRGFQLLQTDHPWHVVGGELAAASRLRDPAPLLGDLPSPTDAALVEPGDRLAVRASGDRPFVATEHIDEPASEWQTLPSTSRPDSTTDWTFDWSRLRVASESFAGRSRARGIGCLRAATGDGNQWFMICRQSVDGEHTRVAIHSRNPRNRDHAERTFADAGDLLRLRVFVEPHRSCAEAAVASELSGDAPRWQPLAIECFSDPLVEQGIAATRDVLFVGTHHNSAPVHAADLAVRSRNGALTDR